MRGCYHYISPVMGLEWAAGQPWTQSHSYGLTPAGWVDLGTAQSIAGDTNWPPVDGNLRAPAGAFDFRGYAGFRMRYVQASRGAGNGFGTSTGCEFTALVYDAQGWRINQATKKRITMANYSWQSHTLEFVRGHVNTLAEAGGTVAANTHTIQPVFGAYLLPVVTFGATMTFQGGGLTADYFIVEAWL